jgi:hypothetical protein
MIIPYEKEIVQINILGVHIPSNTTNITKPFARSINAKTFKHLLLLCVHFNEQKDTAILENSTYVGPVIHSSLHYQHWLYDRCYFVAPKYWSSQHRSRVSW